MFVDKSQFSDENDDCSRSIERSLGSWDLVSLNKTFLFALPEEENLTNI